MTFPDIPPPPGEDEARALEEEALTTVTGLAVTAIRAAIAKILTAFDSARLTGNTLLTIIKRALGIGPPPMNKTFRRVARDARAFGITSAMRGQRVTDGSDLEWRPGRVPDLERAFVDGVAEAVTLAETMALATKQDVMAVIGRAWTTAAYLTGETRRVVNEEINAGTAEVARAAGLNLMWYPERGACLDCLAHAGWVVEPDSPFPPMSFDPQAVDRVWTVNWPPLHPNCRCRVRTTDEPVGPPPADKSSTSMAGALAREARRTVVYQESGHESGTALRRAASDLLNRGAGLPKTVEAKGRRLLKDVPVPAPAPKTPKVLTGGDALKAVSAGLPIRGSLTKPQRAALREYESASFQGVNAALRRGETPRIASAIDSAMTPVTAPIEVWRGLQDFDENETTFTDLAFVSTSVQESEARKFTSGSNEGDRTLMRISVPEGTPAVLISDGGYLSQAEILLARGLTFRVVKDLGVDDRGVRRLDVVVVP